MSFITGINHVQITVPADSESEARYFYCKVLGLLEIKKPERLKSNGGFWMAAGALQVHIGLADSIDRYKSKAHIAFEVENELSCRKLLKENGVDVIENTQIPGFKRFDIRDPFGNRIEFMQRL